MDIKTVGVYVAAFLLAYLVRRIIRRHVSEIRALRPRKSEDDHE